MWNVKLNAIPFMLLSVATLCVGCGSEYQGNSRSTLPADAASLANSPASEQFNTEGYDAIRENEFVEAMQEPQSTFSIDVDTASYTNVRRILNEGRLPPPGAVRLEELVNYFTYNYPQPADDHPFAVNTEIATCPWQSNSKYVSTIQHRMIRPATFSLHPLSLPTACCSATVLLKEM